MPERGQPSRQVPLLRPRRWPFWDSRAIVATVGAARWTEEEDRAERGPPALHRHLLTKVLTTAW